MTALSAPIETDAVIVGAGPVGLYQAFQLGLQEICAHIVDSLPYAGGQCVELYADKPIYDIPAVKVLTGRELVERLLEQLEPFRPTLHLGQEVASLAREPDGRWALATTRGTRFLARTVFIAAGVGAFQPRKLKVEGIAAFEDSQVLYRDPGAGALAGRRVIVAGDEDAAVGAAIALSAVAQVTLLHRRDAFRAEAALVEQLRALHTAGKLSLVFAQPAGVVAADGRLAALRVVDAQAQTRDLPADIVLALLGVSPKLGPVADWGLALERKQLVVDTERFATSESGIFAVGDINTYPGKKKLIACGFHECVLAAFGAAAIVFPDKDIHLLYTTTSTRLHQLLGVA